jgi:hypothetical protein
MEKVRHLSMADLFIFHWIARSSTTGNLFYFRRSIALKKLTVIRAVAPQSSSPS